MCQHWLRRRLLHLRGQRTAMAVGCGHEAPGHVVAEKRDGRGMAAIGHSESATGVGTVLKEQRTLQTIDNPFGPRLSPMS